jgi:hypothetical protein
MALADSLAGGRRGAFHIYTPALKIMHLHLTRGFLPTFYAQLFVGDPDGAEQPESASGTSSADEPGAATRSCRRSQSDDD